jgi:hypothetical protein
VAGISLTPCRTMATEDIRDLQRRTRHGQRQAGGSAVLKALIT